MRQPLLCTSHCCNGRQVKDLTAGPKDLSELCWILKDRCMHDLSRLRCPSMLQLCRKGESALVQIGRCLCKAQVSNCPVHMLHVMMQRHGPDKPQIAQVQQTARRFSSQPPSTEHHLAPGTLLSNVKSRCIPEPTSSCKMYWSIIGMITECWTQMLFYHSVPLHRLDDSSPPHRPDLNARETLPSTWLSLGTESHAAIKTLFMRRGD